MKRRHFLKSASLGIVAMSSTGFIRFNGQRYVGSCETTTDILGPFYRPGAPVRTDLVIEDLPGEVVYLKGKVVHDDCETPIENAKVELWHCSAEEIYDNESDDYLYRGTTYCNSAGDYHFRTQMPVPYDAGGGMYRPAHFHLMISADGYQNLVTQLYFDEDPYLDKDPSSNSPSAKSRILKVMSDSKGDMVIPFNVIMQKEMPVDPAVIDRLTGVYVDDTNKNHKIEYFRHENQLWRKNEVFGENLHYIGNNMFEFPSRGDWGSRQVHFEILANNKIKATSVAIDSKGNKKESVMYALR